MTIHATHFDNLQSRYGDGVSINPPLMSIAKYSPEARLEQNILHSCNIQLSRGLILCHKAWSNRNFPMYLFKITARVFENLGLSVRLYSVANNNNGKFNRCTVIHCFPC